MPPRLRERKILGNKTPELRRGLALIVGGDGVRLVVVDDSRTSDIV